MEHAVPVSLHVLYRRLLAALCIIPPSPGPRATPQNGQNETGEVVAKQVSAQKTGKDHVQQPRATENGGRVVRSKLGEVQLPRVTQNWAHVVRSKLTQSPSRRETAAQLVGVPGGAPEQKCSKTSQERHGNAESTTEASPADKPLARKSPLKGLTPIDPAPQSEAVHDASKHPVERPASSKPQEPPVTDMDGWEDIDSDFEEFGYGNSAAKAVPSCAGIHT